MGLGSRRNDGKSTGQVRPARRRRPSAPVLYDVSPCTEAGCRKCAVGRWCCRRVVGVMPTIASQATRDLGGGTDPESRRRS